MCQPIHSQELLPNRSSLIEQLGGMNQLDFLLISFCESIKNDTDLGILFNHMTVDQLSSTMGSLIIDAFKANLFDVKARNGIVMKNYALFELGMGRIDLQKIKAHFEHALRLCWIEETLIEECILRFEGLQSIFEGEGVELRHSANAHRALASRFQAAPPTSV